MDHEHLLVLPDRAAATDVADELMRDDDTLAERFRETAAVHGGWYDPDPSGPNEPAPPVIDAGDP